jgi:hypothetical protein
VHGLLTLLHGDWRPPDLTIRHRGSKLPTTATGLAVSDDRPCGTVSDRIQKHANDLSQLCDCVHGHCNCTAIKFEKDHMATICDFDFKASALILIRNTMIEKALNRKMQPCYLVPLVVVSRNKGSTYIICELDGTLYHNPVAAYRIIPYFVREYIELPDFKKYSDISVKWLREMERSTAEDPEDPSAHLIGSTREMDMADWQEPSDELANYNAEQESELFNVVT